MTSSGFRYTNDGDTARCEQCGLEVSDWTDETKPFAIHAQRSPTCPFVRSILPERTIFVPTSVDSLTNDDSETPPKRQKIETTEDIYQTNILVEVNTLKLIRQRTFSHWPSHMSPSGAQMIDAGFFNCNVGDRVVCIYCNLICQNWKANADDPFETHKHFSPKCPYVRAQMSRQPATAVHIINGQQSPDDDHSFRCQEIVSTVACHASYAELPRRHATYSTWPNEDLPSVDDLVRAGFFYSGTKTIVTCFYCNGSLQNWGANDNPTIEHARWFPNCAYIKQLCGPELFRRIEESKRAYQARTSSTNANEQFGYNNNGIRSGHLVIPDESTLSRFVAARLDLDISQRLLNQNHKLSVIKRCYEDQLRLKRSDFGSDCDIFLAVIILEKQITYINGDKNNIIIPSQAIAAKQQCLQVPIKSPPPAKIEIEISDSSEQHITNNTAIEDHQNTSSLSNPCALCSVEEKRLACLPCGHLATCVTCANSLRSCPTCRREITAFIRIYL